MKGGLRALYRTLEVPGANPLKDAHTALDAAVLAAYNFFAQRVFWRNCSTRIATSPPKSSAANPWPRRASLPVFSSPKPS